MKCVPNHVKMVSSNTIHFKVTRKSPELIPPKEPTPNEIKALSDLDHQDICGSYFPFIHFYRKNEGKDPVNSVREALAKALVFYYPFAGRLREDHGRKLVVECSGEGVVFVEADADVSLEQYGETLYPPFPNLEELLHYVPTSYGVINCPLLIIQVTRLICGGFILAYCFNHHICDSPGIFQFISAVGELACGAAAPSIPPIWQRHLLTTSHSTHHHHKSNTPTTKTRIPLNELVQRPFFFSATRISALRRRLPPHLQTSSKFETVAAFAWRSWTISLSPKPTEKIKFSCAVDIRNRMNPPLPAGYYGNAVVGSSVVTTAEKLLKFPLDYAVELVKKAKDGAKMEGKSTAAEAAAWTYAVTDLTRLGLGEVDFGWGRATYGGVAKGICDWVPTLPSCYLPYEDEEGKAGIMVPVSLPIDAMELFEEQFEMMTISRFNKSSL